MRGRFCDGSSWSRSSRSSCRRQPFSRHMRCAQERSPTRLALLAAQAISSAILGCESPGPRCLCRYLLNNCCAMNLSRGGSRENSSPLFVRYGFSPSSLRGEAGCGGGEAATSCFLTSLSAQRRKRHRCWLHSLQVCHRPSGRLRSQGKNSRGFDWPHLRQSSRQWESVRTNNEGDRIARGTLLR
jgi:hypothetical protein